MVLGIITCLEKQLIYLLLWPSFSEATKVFLDPFPGCPAGFTNVGASPTFLQAFHTCYLIAGAFLVTFPHLRFVLGWELVLTGPAYKAVWFATGDLCPGVLVTNEVLLLGATLL